MGPKQFFSMLGWEIAASIPCSPFSGWGWSCCQIEVLSKFQNPSEAGLREKKRERDKCQGIRTLWCHVIFFLVLGSSLHLFKKKDLNTHSWSLKTLCYVLKGWRASRKTSLRINIDNLSLSQDTKLDAEKM